MYDREIILKEWNQNGYINVQMFSQDEIAELRTEGKRLLSERDSNWDKHGVEGSQPYKLPHESSELFKNIIHDNRVIDLVRLVMSDDTNVDNCGLQVAQTWMYFKPPGELGRDVHQNIFYTHVNWGAVVNISIAIDDATEENGCMYFYPGSHKEKIAYPIPDDWKDEERMKTNPSGWQNERGKPIFIPGTYVDGMWVEKYPKIYCPAKSGSITLVHSHVLHGSDENKTKDKWRMSFLSGFILKGTHVSEGDDMKRKPIDV